jgi:ketosteroid isomerase-like protein
MPTRRTTLLFCLLPALSLAAADRRAEIEAFNRAFAEATRHMDNAAVLALWDDDGTSLLPSAMPIRGKKAIAAFLDRVVADLPGARMEKFESDCFDIEVSGDWASEWCTEHQIVRFPGEKPPFEGHDGKWRLKREMWNQALAPGKR